MEARIRCSPAPCADALSIARDLDPGLRPVVLESRWRHPELGRWDIVAFGPSCLLRAGPTGAELLEPAGTHQLSTDALTSLQQLMRARRIRRPAGCGLPFIGGSVGVMAYELARQLERLPGNARDDLGLPWLEWACYERAWLCDRVAGRAWWLQVEAPWCAPDWRVPRPTPGTAPEPGQVVSPGLFSTFNREQYLRAVCEVQDWIRRGHIYQANLSQRFAVPFEGSAHTLYARLRGLQPMPFLAWLPLGGAQILSASPERFLKVGPRGHVQTWPIKGTRGRHAEASIDADRARQLQESAKDQAELAMIVDLHRNDLGRVCAYGSVRVQADAQLQSFPGVHHLTGHITGNLRPELDVFDLLRAAFPAGSISGAPKIRALEIIDSLEPLARSAYTGSLGYVGYDGCADLSVAIRTLIITRGWALLGAGGAVTADSQPCAEYQETLDKVAGLLSALHATREHASDS